MYILCLEQDGKLYLWQGGGYFTLNIKQAKKYPTWEAASQWCNRIKRWSLKYMSEEDYQEFTN